MCVDCTVAVDVL